MGLILQGMGTALPRHSMSQADAVDLHTTFCGIDDRRARTLKALYRRSRIRTRHSVLFESSDGPVEERQPFYPPATSKRLIRDLPSDKDHEDVVEQLTPIPVWNKWPVLLLFLLMLIGEWVLRKMGGMI